MFFWTCRKGIIESATKVSEISGKVSQQAAYHHGEDSLDQTIIVISQNFVILNSINGLEPVGFFWYRHACGSNACSPRYIYTKLEEITRSIFKKDDHLLFRTKRKKACRSNLFSSFQSSQLYSSSTDKYMEFFRELMKSKPSESGHKNSNRYLCSLKRGPRLSTSLTP